MTKPTVTMYEKMEPCSDAAIAALRITISPSDAILLYSSMAAEAHAESTAGDNSDLAKRVRDYSKTLNRMCDLSFGSRKVCKGCVARILQEKSEHSPAAKMIAGLFHLKVIVAEEGDTRSVDEIVQEALAEDEHEAADKDPRAAATVTDIMSRVTNQTRH